MVRRSVLALTLAACAAAGIPACSGDAAPQVADLETHASHGGMFSALGAGNGRIARMGQWLKESF